MRHINRLNEEIARWAFEIRVNNNPDWFIAFTNPTAGPWKTIKARSLITNEIGEVYRFALEEDRPDIIMYNDTIKCIIIFEAKDDLRKLIETKQIKKSSDVTKKLAKKFKTEIVNDFWRGREDYVIVLGLLWGSEEHGDSEESKNNLFKLYLNRISSDRFVFQKGIIGIETICVNEKLECSLFFKVTNPKVNSFFLSIKNSLTL